MKKLNLAFKNNFLYWFFVFYIPLVSVLFFWKDYPLIYPVTLISIYLIDYIMRKWREKSMVHDYKFKMLVPTQSDFIAYYSFFEFIAALISLYTIKLILFALMAIEIKWDFELLLAFIGLSTYPIRTANELINFGGYVKFYESEFKIESLKKSIAYRKIKKMVLEEGLDIDGITIYPSNFRSIYLNLDQQNISNSNKMDVLAFLESKTGIIVSK